MSDEERKKIYAETRADLLKRQLSNAENYDKAILSVATAALGFSLVFLKEIAPIYIAKKFYLIEISWFFLVLSILATLLSFLSSQQAIKKQLVIAEEYYLKNNNDIIDKKNWFSIVTDYLNLASAVFFIIAIGMTTYFVSVNTTGDISMSKDNRVNQIPLKEGAPIPTMQKIPTGTENRGAPVPPIQQVEPSQSPSQSPSNPSSQGNSANSQGNSSGQGGTPSGGGNQ